MRIADFALGDLDVNDGAVPRRQNGKQVGRRRRRVERLDKVRRQSEELNPIRQLLRRQVFDVIRTDRHSQVDEGLVGREVTDIGFAKCRLGLVQASIRSGALSLQFFEPRKSRPAAD